MNKMEWIDAINKIADDLEDKADKKCEQEINYHKAYCEGYKKSTEDFRKEMVDKMYEA